MQRTKAFLKKIWRKSCDLLAHYTRVYNAWVDLKYQRVGCVGSSWQTLQVMSFITFCASLVSWYTELFEWFVSVYLGILNELMSKVSKTLQQVFRGVLDSGRWHILFWSIYRPNLGIVNKLSSVVLHQN